MGVSKLAFSYIYRTQPFPLSVWVIQNLLLCLYQVAITVRGFKHMGARICCFVLAVQMVSLVSATSRTFASNDDVGFSKSVPGRSQSPYSYQVSWGSEQGMEGAGVGLVNEEANYEGMEKIGSSPPSCEHKCYGCIPCEAIQVPTTSKTHNHFGVNYANYEPEGWKCKCGPSFYSP